MEEILKRITFNPDQCGGKPCIRGMRIRVIDVLQLIANGLTFEQILEDLPDLEKEDIQASVLFALKRIDHTVLAA
ncbi:MAG TPA: DUF433 domain-containing protein [Leptospiraceae bacterium]|nr:DUF433 domain-containing protein [Leptospiraceae bacterium]HNF28138.1 DUF433 domain-containing protein [Leptospiraceae bacterium]HNJ00054.1 DUF433 domain-containing protein [Leptospiraceae bacterium]HNM06354.1 DUF433 domain-containing protein [Leptospiraceae bacterium]HNN06983.1 DUF433 domain-containing protein [Leptospiraceae bacterium]